MESRINRVKEFWDRSKKLRIDNLEYKEYFLNYIYQKLKEDDFENDITTKSLINNVKINCEIKAKQEGIIAGVEEVACFFEKEGINFEIKKKDGDFVRSGDVIFYLPDNSEKLLSVERVVLNILQRMCGIATMTYDLNKKLKNGCFITATRKTLISLLDKKAVSVGGGLTHRLDLGDFVLIKDNHVKLMGGIKNLIDNFNGKNVEVEVNSREEFLDVISKFSDKNKNAILFDNMKSEEIKEIITNDGASNILFEASGDINENTVEKYAESGVDVVSMGALTHSVKSFDISLNVI
tara:strand:+ start:111 stop:992 length:882 start_codon:yes stop_codon:yes gene_type:complete